MISIDMNRKILRREFDAPAKHRQAGTVVNKLTADEANQIRELAKSGNHSQGEIARMFGVSHGTVNAIHTGRSWNDKAFIPVAERADMRRAKVSDEDVKQIVELYGSMRMDTIAEQFGVSVAYVSRAIRVARGTVAA